MNSKLHELMVLKRDVLLCALLLLSTSSGFAKGPVVILDESQEPRIKMFSTDEGKSYVGFGGLLSISISQLGKIWIMVNDDVETIYGVADPGFVPEDNMPFKLISGDEAHCITMPDWEYPKRKREDPWTADYKDISVLLDTENMELTVRRNWPEKWITPKIDPPIGQKLDKSIEGITVDFGEVIFLNDYNLCETGTHSSQDLQYDSLMDGSLFLKIRDYEAETFEVNFICGEWVTKDWELVRHPYENKTLTWEFDKSNSVEIIVDSQDKEVRYFNLNGCEISKPSPNRPYIRLTTDGSAKKCF